MKERSGYLSRQKNFGIVSLIVCALSGGACAQTSPFAIGAESWGIANATVAGSDSYAIFNNIASLAGNKEASVLSSYDSHYNFGGLSTMAFAAVVPFSEDVSTGFSVQRFGDRLYNEISLGLGAAHRIGRFSLGVKTDYLQTAVMIPSLAFSRKAFVMEFGGIAQVTKDLFFGAHLYNMTQSSYSGIYGNQVPTSLRAGFLYSPLKTVRLSTEMEKNTDFPISVKAGLAYQIREKIWLRTGIASSPLTHHFGAGFKQGKFSINYAAHSNAQLGWSHHLSLAYAFRKINGKE